jgi:hypothetical protein
MVHLRPRSPWSRHLRAFLTVLVVASMLQSQAVAKPPGGAPPGGGGGGSAGGGSSATGPSAPTTPVTSAFYSFYIVVDGSEPNFNTYATELIAKQLAADFVPQKSVYFVAAPGWTEDTLDTACQNDPNAIGGLVVKFTSFFVESDWLVYNTESQHVTPVLFLKGCHGVTPYVATPPLHIYTIKSRNETTVPIAPIVATGALFTYPGGMNAFSVGDSALALATVATSLSGNVGYLNQGHEALTIARQISTDASAFTGFVCNYGNFVGRYRSASATTPLTSPNPGPIIPPSPEPSPTPSLDPGFANAPADLRVTAVQQQLKSFANIRGDELTNFPELYAPYPSPAPTDGKLDKVSTSYPKLNPGMSPLDYICTQVTGIPNSSPTSATSH